MRWIIAVLLPLAALAGCSDAHEEAAPSETDASGPEPPGSASESPTGSTADPTHESTTTAPPDTSTSTTTPAQTSSPSPSPSPSPEPKAPERHDGSFSMDMGLLGLEPAEFTPGGETFPWDVPSDATAMRVEAQWTCDLAVCPLDWNITDPTGAVTLESTLSPLAWSPASVATGTWSVQVAGTLASAVSGEVRVTVFFDGDVPEGYSAYSG